MPRVADPVNVAAREAAKRQLEDEVRELIPENNPVSVELEKTINQAKELLVAKSKILVELQKKRQLATLLTEGGSGSQAQVLWVREYLPRKSRKNGSDSTEIDIFDADEAEIS